MQRHRECDLEALLCELWIAGTTPTVDTVTALRQPKPDGGGDTSPDSGEYPLVVGEWLPIPMKTTLEIRPGPWISPSRMARAATRTWSRISAVDRFRWSPPCPVAQNGHAIPHPAWLEMHTVARSGYRMSTLSTSEPS